MIDLHMHSLYSSDGEFTPIELAEKCAENGITIMAVTDHNCVQANAEAKKAANEKGILYITGIEIDCVYQGSNFHLLGYGIDVSSSDFQKIENAVRIQGNAASLCMLKKTQALGFSVTEMEMQNIAKDSCWPETWTGEMFAEVLLKNPKYASHSLLKPYRVGGERADNPYVNFYWDFYSQGKPCYVEIHYPGMKEMIDCIHQNHGLAVLAHPGANLKGKENLLDGIVKLGIDGIEAFSSYHSPAQALCYFQDAKKYKLFSTSGSDFHGKTKPAIGLGKYPCPIAQEDIQQQFERIKPLAYR